MVVINLSTYMIRETEDDILLMDHTLQERDYASMPNNAADVSFTIQVFSSSLRQGSRADPAWNFLHLCFQCPSEVLLAYFYPCPF